MIYFSGIKKILWFQATREKQYPYFFISIPCIYFGAPANFNKGMC